MGFLVFVPGLAQPGHHTTFHLIDGQQRLTTSSLLLTAMRNVAREVGQQDLADEIHQYYLVHPLKKGEQHYRLLPKERDHDSYLSIVDAKGIALGRMAEAIAYFEELLSALVVQTPGQLRQLFDTVCQRLEFMCATLEAENAYNIFKSLNSIGVPLGPSDLIRNFVFMHVPPDDHDQFDRELWSPLEGRFTRSDLTLDEERFSKFFRDFMMSSGRYVPPNATFPTFEARFEATEFSPEQLVRTLIAKSQDYAVISGDAPDESDCVTKALVGLNLLDSSTTYCLLLALFEKRAIGAIDSGQLADAIEMLRGYIMRRFICGESSRGYGPVFVRALAKDEGATLQTLKTYLLDRGWPDDHQFETAFAEFPLYQRGYTRQVLDSLERARGHKEPADLQATQVEHILPQALNDAWRKMLGADAERIHGEWLHRPGNLTLTAYNQELWNHPFQTKRVRYAQSNVVMTRELETYDRWGEAEIRERGRLLAKEAAKIWIGPMEHVTRSERARGDDDDEPIRYALRRRFWSGLNLHLAAKYPNLPTFESRPRPTIRIPSGIRHIGVELRLGLRHENVGIDVWFWREASLPLWNIIRRTPQPYNNLIDATWIFEQVEGRDEACMFINQAASDLRNESSWPTVYTWIGAKLSLVYEGVVPLLRVEMERQQ